METLQQIWTYALPIGGGLTVGAIVIAIATFLFKNVLGGQLTKQLNKIDIQAIENKAVDGGLKRIKEISFTQSIEPLVKAELVKISENANKDMKATIDELKAQNVQLLAVLKAFAAYFDNSIGVSDEAKLTLKDTIEGAEAVILPQTKAECKVVYVEVEKPTEAEITATTVTEAPKMEETKAAKKATR